MIRFLASRRALTCILPILLALLLPVGPAFGQATGGLLPDPITSADLDTYARRLDLSPEQRQGMDSFHSDYLDQFEDLREREIDEFLLRLRDVRRGMMRLQNYSEIKKAMKDLDRLEGRIRSLDERFFEQTRGVLSEQQQLMFPRVMQQRERVRYRLSGVLFGVRNSAVNVDLSELSTVIDLTPQQAADVDPTLADYERLLTVRLRELHQTTSSAVLDALKNLEEMGFTEETMSNRDGARRMFEAFRTLMEEILAKIAEQATKVSDLNRSTLRQISSILPEGPAQDLRWRYQRRAYPEIGAQGAQVVKRYDSALELDRLSEDQRAAITAGRSDFIRKDNRLSDDLIDLADEDRKVGGFVRFDVGEERAERRRKMRELGNEAEALRDSALRALEATLGPDLADAVATRMASESSEDQEEEGTNGRAGRGGGVGPDGPGRPRWAGRGEGAANEDSTANPFLFLPGPITDRELDTYSRHLGIPETSRVILDALYADYRDGHDQWMQTHLEPLRAHQQKLWAIDPEGGRVEPPSEADVDRLYDLRRSALEALRQLDASFLGDVGMLVDNEEGSAEVSAGIATTARLSLARDRQVYRSASKSPNMRMGRGGPMGGSGDEISGEAAVDIVLLLFEIDLAREQQSAVEGYVSAWEQAMTAALRDRYDKADRLGRAAAKMTGRFARQRGGRPGRPSFDQRAFEEIREGRQQLTESSQRLAALNRDTMNDLTTALPPDVAALLRTAFLRAAFADVYEDPASVEPLFAAALVMEDLAAHQRSRVVELRTEYRAEYASICEEMIQTRLASSESGAAGERPDWQQRAEARTRTERLEFQRSELNSKTSLRLRGLLTDQQVRRIPGLAEAE